jgi:hypothetical protein
MTTVIVLLVLLFTFGARDAAAREWRGCSAAIQIISDGRLSTLWQFEGRGSCRSRAYANDCRRAARDAIANCVRAAWRDRWSRRLPGECASGTESSNRPHVKGIMNTNFGRGAGSQGDQDFKWAVERNACCFLNPAGGQVRVEVGADTSGDTGCSSPKSLQEGPFDLPLDLYDVDCARVRAQGYCAVRTNGR